MFDIGTHVTAVKGYNDYDVKVIVRGTIVEMTYADIDESCEMYGQAVRVRCVEWSDGTRMVLPICQLSVDRSLTS